MELSDNQLQLNWFIPQKSFCNDNWCFSIDYSILNHCILLNKWILMLIVTYFDGIKW